MKTKKILTIIIEILVLLFLYSQRNYFNFKDVNNIITWIKSYGGWSFLSYILFCIVASVFFTPLAVQRSIALIIFGPLLGGLLAIGGPLSGAVFCFLLSRYIFSSYFRKKFENHKLYFKITNSVKKNKELVMVSTRLNPVFSNTLQNYLYGLTELSFKDYLLWTTILYIPSTILFALWVKLATTDNLFSKKNLTFLIGILALIAIIMIFIIYMKKRSKDLVDKN